MPDEFMGKCYKCKWRGDAPYSAHSTCEHPDRLSDGLGVTGDPHGIKKGWFGWPFNFDPVWLRSCDGFKQKDAE